MIPQPATPTTVVVNQASPTTVVVQAPPTPPPGATVNVDNRSIVFDNRSVLQQAIDARTSLDFTILDNRQTTFAQFYAQHNEMINTYARQYRMNVQNAANILFANMHGGGGPSGPGGGGPGDGGSSGSGGGGQLAIGDGILALAPPPPVAGGVPAIALPPPPDPPPQTAPRPKAKAKAKAKGKAGGVQKPIRRAGAFARRDYARRALQKSI